MLRNFGITLLFLGLMAAAFDGFRERERTRTAPTPNGGSVHISEAIAIPPNR